MPLRNWLHFGRTRYLANAVEYFFGHSRVESSNEFSFMIHRCPAWEGREDLPWAIMVRKATIITPGDSFLDQPEGLDMERRPHGPSQLGLGVGVGQDLGR